MNGPKIATNFSKSFLQSMNQIIYLNGSKNLARPNKSVQIQIHLHGLNGFRVGYILRNKPIF